MTSDRSVLPKEKCDAILVHRNPMLVHEEYEAPHGRGVGALREAGSHFPMTFINRSGDRGIAQAFDGHTDDAMDLRG